MDDRSLLGVYGIFRARQAYNCGGEGGRRIKQDAGLESYMAMSVGLAGLGVGSQGKEILNIDCSPS